MAFGIILAMKFSVVVPCFNEEGTLEATVSALIALASPSLEIEVVVVDDCSTDGSLALARRLAGAHSELKVLAHETNRGKGAALRTGFLAATGDAVGVQDADGEYDPQDYLKMLDAIAGGRAEVIYGSRYAFRAERRVLRYWHSTMNKFLTWFSNALSDMALTDMETCYKLFRRDVIAEIAPRLVEERFGFEPEVTARVAAGMRARGWRVVEFPVSYKPRTFSEGKKIGWKDGIRALWCIVKYNLLVS